VPLTPHRRQLSLFGVEAADPSPLDLSGLLAGAGRVSRMGGTARVSVTVDSAWRVHVLAAELALRGIEVSWRHAGRPEESDVRELVVVSDPAEDVSPGGPASSSPAQEVRQLAAGEEQGAPAAGGYEVRTAYSSLLAPLAAAWLRGPPGFFYLNGPRLRLWTAAAGVLDGRTLTLLSADGPGRDAVGAALARAGLPATAVEAGFRITGLRRLARLAELVGERPQAAPPECWPTPFQ
jgi:hypothetical protein